MKIVAPSYFYPGPIWDQLIHHAESVEYAIINPASGPGDPGSSRDQNYLEVTAKAQSRGISILGYVATTYTEKPLEAVKAEMQLYRDWYGVDGFFFDEVSSKLSDVDYYGRIYLESNGPAIINPGVIPHPAYSTVSDIICVQERNGDWNTDRTEPQVEWMNSQPPEKFWSIVYNVPTAAQMRRLLRRARKQNIGYVYITDDGGENPYDRLPSYWGEEVKFL